MYLWVRQFPLWLWHLLEVFDYGMQMYVMPNRVKLEALESLQKAKVAQRGPDLPE